MGLFTEKYNTPFDNEQMRRPVDEKFTASHIRPAKYLSTRASLLLGYTLVSLCLEFMIAGNAIWWPVACSFACLFVWALHAEEPVRNQLHIRSGTLYRGRRILIPTRILCPLCGSRIHSHGDRHNVSSQI